MLNRPQGRSYVHRVQKAAAAADRLGEVRRYMHRVQNAAPPLTGTGEVRRYVHRVQKAAAAADRVPAKFAVTCIGCKAR